VFYDKFTRRKPMTEEITRKRRGAPRTHGFYSKILDEKERLDYKHAVEVEGLDAEIALLRVKIKTQVENYPENIKLITQATNALVRMVIAKYNISKDDKPGIKEAVLNVLKEVVLPLGIGTILKK
jgi:hypothetical protein